MKLAFDRADPGADGFYPNRPTTGGHRMQHGPEAETPVARPSVIGASISVPGEGRLNSDAVRCSGRLFAVADGVDAVPGSGERVLREVERLLGRPPRAAQVRGALHAANWTLWAHNGAAGRTRATITLALWTGHRFVIGHIGDSRALHISARRVEQLTVDDVADGADRVDDVRRLGSRRVAGRVQVVSLHLDVGERLLLVTDGVWRALGSAIDLRSLAATTPQEGCDLIAAVVRTGIEDASAVLVARTDEAVW
jgi:hypothetical protein